MVEGQMEELLSLHTEMERKVDVVLEMMGMDDPGWSGEAKRIGGNFLFWLFFWIFFFYFNRFIVAPLVSARRKMDFRSGLDWDVRVMSTAHALLSAAGATYLVLFDTALIEDKVFGRSPFAEFELSCTLGYWVFDLALMFIHFKELGELPFIAHHVGGVLSFWGGLYEGQMYYFGAAVQLTEYTSPLINNRWFLDKLGMKESLLYTINGAGMLLGFIVFRIVLIPIILFSMWAPMSMGGNMEEVLMAKLYVTSFITSGTVLALLLSCWWTYLIFRGLMKTLAKNKKGKTE